MRHNGQKIIQTLQVSKLHRRDVDAAGIVEHFGDQFGCFFQLVDPDGPVAEPGQVKFR